MNEAKVNEDSINKIIIFIVWIIMILGSIAIIISRAAQGIAAKKIFFNVMLFDLSFIVPNGIATLTFLFLKNKKYRRLLKYLVTATYCFVVPVYSYISLESGNFDAWAVCFIAIMFTILHMSIPLIIFASVLIFIFNNMYLVVFWSELQTGMVNPISQILLRNFLVFFCTIIAIAITKTTNYAFQAAEAKEEEIVEDRESAFKTLKAVKEFSTSLKNLSEKSANISSKLSSYSENQASSVEQIAASTEELMASIEEINKNANVAANKMNEIVDEVQSGMNSLNDSTKEMMELVNFSKIMIDSIELVNEIAENTNLVALNAAIEAARAGSAGKGFAVVATEIRKLAEKSTKAAQNVGGLLKESEIKIRNGANLNKNVNTIYSQISEKLGNISGVFQQISFATQELNRGGKEISMSLESINLTSNQNFELAKEIEQSSNLFKKETKKLNFITRTAQKINLELNE